jgi:peptide/nickel transport system substrate-binding protein
VDAGAAPEGRARNSDQEDDVMDDRVRATRGRAVPAGGSGWRGDLTRAEFLRLSAVLGAGLTMPGFLAGCGGDDGADDAAPTGHVRFLSAENFWADWEPYQAFALSQWRLNKQVYDYLLDFPNGDLTQPEEMLATSWEQVDDRTWEFELREGVQFHDGTPFTAEDVKASIERASGATEAEVALSLFWVPATVEVVDEHRVRLSTEQPYGALFGSLFGTPIVSHQDLEGSEEQLREQPNGTGPFRLVENAPTRKVMEANTDYWGGAPNIERMTWEFVQDPQTRLDALRTGQAQAIDRVPPEHRPIIEGDGNLEITSVTGIENVGLFVRPGRSELWDGNQQFREAVAWSIDRQAIVEELLGGETRLADSFLPSEGLYHQTQSPEYTLDVDRARQLLEEAGVPDGGAEFELWIATGFLPRAREIGEAIADTMRQVGLNPRIVTSDVSGLIDDVFSEGGSGLMYHLSWSSSGDPHHALAPLIQTGGIWSPSDEEVDRLLQAGAETTDEGEREAAYSELQSYLWQTLHHIPLYYSEFAIGHTAELQDLRVLPNVFETYFYPARMGG